MTAKYPLRPLTGSTMKSDRETLLQWIDCDRNILIALASDLIQAKSPNPPGETKQVAACITKFLDDEKLDYEVVSPLPDRPNIVATFAGKTAGRALAASVLELNQSVRRPSALRSGSLRLPHASTRPSRQARRTRSEPGMPRSRFRLLPR